MISPRVILYQVCATEGKGDGREKGSKRGGGEGGGEKTGRGKEGRGGRQAYKAAQPHPEQVKGPAPGLNLGTTKTIF